MIYVLFEAAIRPSELLTMRISSVILKMNTASLQPTVKRVLNAYPCHLKRATLRMDRRTPLPNRSPSTLWCAIDNKYEGTRLSYTNFRLTIRLGDTTNKLANMKPYR